MDMPNTAGQSEQRRAHGYGIGYGFGDAIQHAVGPLGYVALAGVFALTLVIAACRILRARRATH
jgi:hypothetical protein